MSKESILLTKSEDFAVEIVNLYKVLSVQRQEYIISKQLLRSATSIGANMSEAVYAISDNDFLAKAHISLKECSETAFWLRILKRCEYITSEEFSIYYNRCEEILKMLVSTTKTMKNKINNIF